MARNKVQQVGQDFRLACRTAKGSHCELGDDGDSKILKILWSMQNEKVWGNVQAFYIEKQPKGEVRRVGVIGYSSRPSTAQRMADFYREQGWTVSNETWLKVFEKPLDSDGEVG